MFKIFGTQKIFGSKKFKKFFLRSYKKSQKFLDKKLSKLENSKHLLISIPKYIELNS